ncbi:unnamed protein product [Calypogeia fissa]
MSSIVAVGARDVEALRATKEKVSTVRRLIQKDRPLTKKQTDYCDDACIERSLRARGGNVRKAAKLLKSSLAWRESFEVDHLIADEFSAELASGAAYIAGHDGEGRPVVIIKKRNYNNFTSWSQKRYLRYLIFTVEVAVASMLRGVDQWVLIIDVGQSKMSSPSSSTILGTLKILSENYPERLAKAFIVDSPSVFYYLWKGICPFVDQATKGKVSFVFSKDYVRTPEEEKLPSIRHLLQETQTPKKSDKGKNPNSSVHSENGAALVTHSHSRSVSFSQPSTACNSPAVQGREFSSFRAERNFWFPGLISSNKNRKLSAGDGSSFRFSLSKRFDQQFSGVELKEKTNSFRPYWNFFKSPYNEAAYRATMKPPLGGLKSIITSSLKSHSS